jgi:hypothetical protein
VGDFVPSKAPVTPNVMDRDAIPIDLKNANAPTSHRALHKEAGEHAEHTRSKPIAPIVSSDGKWNEGQEEDCDGTRGRRVELPPRLAFKSLGL